jgi:hypothetical protein
MGIDGNRHGIYPLGQYGISVPHRMCRSNRSRRGFLVVWLRHPVEPLAIGKKRTSAQVDARVMRWVMILDLGFEEAEEVEELIYKLRGNMKRFVDSNSHCCYNERIPSHCHPHL